MKIRVLVALAIGLIPVFACSQPSQAVKDSEVTIFKIAKLNIAKFLTPVLMKKAQINSILTTLEKCHVKEKEIREMDAVELKKVDADVDKALDASLNKGSYPKRELLEQLLKVQNLVLVRRQIATNEMCDMVYETFKKTLNEGQMNAIKNLIDPKFVDGSIKVDKLNDEEKIRLYIRQIVLDPLAYDILKALAKSATE